MYKDGKKRIEKEILKINIEFFFFFKGIASRWIIIFCFRCHSSEKGNSKGTIEGIIH